MNRSYVLAISSMFLGFSALVGCAAPTSGDDGAPADEEDVKAAKAVTGAEAQTLMDALVKADAPSATPPGMLGVGSRVARIHLTTAQGGMAHFISQGGELSTADGAALGDFVKLGLAWTPVRDALVKGGAKWTTKAGDHGASSSAMLATVECHQVVAPNAKPSCTVTPITVTAADASTLMTMLRGVDAPSSTPPGMLGVGSRIARVTLTTAQGGMAHFISQGLSVDALDGKHLGDVTTAGVAWADLRTALLDGAAVWTTTNGAHGASSSKIVATVECSQVVAPSAKPSCTVTPEAP